MIKISYKLVSACALHKKGYAYIKAIEGGVRDKLELTFIGAGNGVLRLGGKEIPVKDSVATVAVSELKEGKNELYLAADKLSCTAEPFVSEKGFISRVSPSESYLMEVAEAFELIEERLAESERVVKELAKSFVGAKIFDFE